MIWFKPVDFATYFHDRPKSIADVLGIDFTELGDDFIKACMPVDERTRQPYGILHGGASVVLAGAG